MGKNYGQLNLFYKFILFFVLVFCQGTHFEHYIYIMYIMYEIFNIFSIQKQNIFILVLFSYDATHEVKLGKFINDSPKTFVNSIMKVKCFDNRPYLCLYALKDINNGTELR